MRTAIKSATLTVTVDYEKGAPRFLSFLVLIDFRGLSPRDPVDLASEVRGIDVPPAPKSVHDSQKAEGCDDQPQALANLLLSHQVEISVGHR